MKPALRILIVDDDQGRHDRIVREVRKWSAAEFRHRHGATWVDDDDLAWARVVFLDHDMCERVFSRWIYSPDNARPCPAPTAAGHCGCATGMDLVRLMASLPYRPSVVVHTANPVAAPEMARTLLDAGFQAVRMAATAWGQCDWRALIRWAADP